MKFRQDRTIHFVGIGGVGMSGIAEVLLQQGHDVQGSDIEKNHRVKRLEERGATIYQGHDSEQVSGADVVVQTSAVDGGDNVEIQAARSEGIPVIPRAEMLAELMRVKQGLAVAGTHGKTTTTALLSHLFRETNRDPTVVVGGQMRNSGVGAHLGSGDEMIVEADESDGTLLYLRPISGIVTNIENDHLDYYDSMDHMESTFLEFINSIPFYGRMLLCGEDERLRSLVPELRKPYWTYGFSPDFDLHAADIEPVQGGTDFTLHARGQSHQAHLGIPGKHNVLNALGAVGLGLEHGLSLDGMVEALPSFRGVKRRFDYQGKYQDTPIYDDYAHHPTEIRKTLQAAERQFPDHQVLAVFQPHRYSRTRQLAEEIGQALREADRVCLMGIYPAGEEPIDGVDLDFLEDRMAPSLDEHSVDFVPGHEGAAGWVREHLKNGREQVLMTLGAGDVGDLADWLLESREEVTRGASEA